MKKMTRKVVSLLLAVMMVFAMSATAFAATTEATALVNPRFLRDSGEALPMGMGEGVIVGGTIDGNNIVVNTKPYTRVIFTGYIKSAYYIGVDGETYGTNLITVDADGNGVLGLDASKVVTTPAGGKGIYLKLTFDMSPFTPPGMKGTMNGYFTCDNL